MENKIKRFLSFTLALLMIISLMPQLSFGADAADTDDTLYLKPNSNWLMSGARFAMYTWGGSAGEKWISMSDTDSDGIYEGVLPAGYTNVIFCRMNPSTTANNWDNKWNQSGDLVYDGIKNLCTIADGQWDCGTNVTWSTYTPAPVEPENPDDEVENVTVYCINSTKWANMYAYTWDSNGYVEWPGAVMNKTGETVNGFDVYAYTFPENFVNIIFNNGSGSQTADLTVNAGQYYDIKGAAWYASLSDVPVVDPLATDASLPGSFNTWDTVGSQFKLTAEGAVTATVTMTLEANTTYEFKVVNNGLWLSTDTAITGDVSGLEFSSSVAYNAELVSKAAGEYVFTFDLSANTLSVKYPHEHDWSNKDGICADADCGEQCEHAEYVEGVCSVCGMAEAVVAYAAKVNGIGYETLQAAIEAAVLMTGDVTIEIQAGTYAEDINLTNAAVTVGDASVRPNITFKPAAGADVILAGTVTLGYRNQTVGASMWNGEVTFDGITFDHAEASKNSLDIQDIKGITLNNCVLNGEGEYGITSPRGNGTTKALFTGCTFNTGAMQVLGQIGANLVVDGCTMNNFSFNVQAGATPGMTIKNSTFNLTLTDAHVDNSFYAVRTNACPVNLTGIEVNVDSTVAGVAADQAKWAIFWARKDSNAKWAIADCEINLTDAALAQTELLLAKNDAGVNNGPGRMAFTNLTSESNDVAVLIERSEGYLNAEGKPYLDGEWQKPASVGSINGGLVNIQNPNRTFLTIESFISFANESIVVKIFDANGTLLATSVLVDTDRVLLGKENFSLSTMVGINCTDEWWDTTWEDGKLRADFVPAKATLFVDGAEMNTVDIQMRAADTEAAINWADVPGVPPVPFEKDEDNKVATINNLEGLLEFAAAVNGGNTFKGWTINLAADINLAAVATFSNELTSNWEPLTHFQGTFDGQNHTISNLVINMPSSNNVGFFGKTTDGEIKNLVFENAIVTGRGNVGVVAGTPYTSKYTNIKLIGHVEVNGRWYVGGVGGRNAYANWTDITVDVDAASYVKADSVDGETAYRTYVGGIVGFNGEGGHTFKNIASNIKVIGSTCDIGGLFGIAHYGNKFENVTFTGSVEAPEGAEEVGGIAGVWHNQKGQTVTFEDVTSTGTVTIGGEDVTEEYGIVGGAYNASNETPENSGSLIINGQEAWLCVAKIGEEKYATLQAAIDAVQNGETITLQCNVNVTAAAYGSNALNHARAVDFTLDLNGYTLSADTGNSVFRFNISGSGATSDVTITIKNGTIVAGANTWCAVMNAGVSADAKAIMNLENLTIEASKAGDLAVKAWDNGVINAKNVTVNATNGAGGFYAVGGEIVLDNCTVNQTGLHTAPYLSMAFAVSGGGKLTINSGVYSAEPTAAAEGNNQGTSHGSWVGGVMNSGGTLIINGGTFSNGNYGENSLATNPRGLIMVDTGAVLEINGGQFNALGSVVELTNNLGDASKNPTADIYGGNFVAGGNVLFSGYPTGLLYVYGGTYNLPIADELCADGYMPNKIAEGVYGVKAEIEAQIGRVKYATLAEAIAAAEEGDTILLVADVIVNQVIVIDKNITIADYTTYSITTVGDGAFALNDGVTLTLDDVIVNAKVYAEHSEPGAMVNDKAVTGVAGQPSQLTCDGDTVTITNPSWVAKIGDTYYMTLAEAMAAAENGATVVLLTDIEMSEMIVNKNTITLDLNGKTITGTDNTSKNFSLIDNRGTLTITGNGKMTLTATVNSGWSRYSAVIANNPGGKLIIENGHIEHLGGTDMSYGIDNLTNGKGTYAETVINGGTIKSTYRAIRQFLNGVEAQNILTINGGTIEGANKAVWMQDPSKNANTGTLTIGENAQIKGDIYLFVTAGSTEWPVEVSIAAAALAEGSEITTGNVPEGYHLQLLNGVYAVNALAGEGTEENPYLIEDLADLILFRDSVNAGETVYNAAGVYVALAADIDMAGIDWSVNIGDDCNATFDGIFDGQNHTIKNLNSTETAQKSDGYICTGLFGAIYGSAVVKNLVIENVSIDTGDFEGNNVGAVVGFAYSCTGSIENITVKGDIKINASAVSGVGVILGYDYSGKLTVKDCSVIGNEGSYINGGSFVGGVIGYSNGATTISGCAVENLDITGKSCVAGIAGGIYNANFKAIACTVKNVDLVATSANWLNSVAVVVGSTGKKVTVSNITVENVTANGVATDRLVGSRYQSGAQKPVAKIQAHIGDVYYVTFAEALKASQSGDVITLLDNVKLDAVAEATGKTVDLNGYTITGDVVGTVKINGGTYITSQGYKMVGPEADYYISSDAVLTIEGAQGNITIHSGTMKLAQSWWTGEGQVLTVEAAATFIIPEGLTLNVLSTVIVDGTLVVDGEICLYTINASVKAPEGLNVTGNVKDYVVVYSNGVYKLSAVVAKIGNTGYATFADALAAVQDGETIVLTGVAGSEIKTEIEFTNDIEFTITGNAPEYALPVITFQNATVNIKDAVILIPELDARQNATINVINSIVYDAGGDSIVKSYYNGAINISGNSVVYTMQVTTMGYITISDTAELHATWQTNVYGNGMIVVEDDATFKTAALHLTGKDYSGRDNTDADRVGKPATIIVDGATFIVGKVLSRNGADYSYNSSKGINVGTIAGKAAVLDIKNGATVNFYMANGETANIGADGIINIADSVFTVECRKADGSVTLNNSGKLAVQGNSSLNIPALTGTAVFVTGDTTLTDTYVGGNVYAGYGANKTESLTLTICGSFTVKALYVGNKYEHYTNGEVHKLVITEDAVVNMASLYVRPTCVATVSGATVNTGDLLVRGSMTVTDSTMSHKSSIGGGTGHWTVYEDDDATKTATLTLINSTVSTNYLVVGSNSNSKSAANSNANLVIDGGSLTLGGTLYLQGSEAFAGNKIELLNGATVAAKTLYADEYTKFIIDAEDKVAGDVVATGDVSAFNATLEVINNATVYAEAADSKITLIAYGVSVTDAEGNVSYYKTLQDAINAATNGSTITLLIDNSENVTVQQAPNVQIVIDGNGKTMFGTITVDGRSQRYETAALTIKNVNFDATNISKDASINLGGTNATRYTSNVSVINCSFTDNDQTAVGIKSYTGGCKNLTVTGCTATGMHSLMQLYNTAGVTVSGCEITECKNGISVRESKDVNISDCTILVTGYGIRADGKGGNMVVSDVTITADLPIVVRNTVSGYDLKMEGTNNLTGSNEKGYDVIFTAGDDGTYEEPAVNISLSGAEDLDVFPVYKAKVNDVHYMSLDAALAAAKSGDVVTMLADAEQSFVMISAGVQLDLNGKNLTAATLVSFGDIIDSADGVGLLKITTSSVHMSQENSYLPIYDSANGGYKFFAYEFDFLGEKNNGTAVRYGVTIRFNNLAAYDLIATGESGLTIAFQMEINKPVMVDGVATTRKVTYTMEYSAESFADWATNAKAYYGDPANTGNWAMTMSVGGLNKLPEGTTYSMHPVMEVDILNATVNAE